MKYKLAKKLKDAGFPNSEEWEIGEVLDEGLQCFYNDGDNIHYKPTLSELIDACGENIKSIRLFCNFRLKEYGVQEELQGLDDVKWYSTPKEAFAKLWLKLNE